MVGVSGFFFGGGPESMRAGALAAAAYFVAVVACLAAPVVGFILNRQGKISCGIGGGLAASRRRVAGARDSCAVLEARSIGIEAASVSVHYRASGNPVFLALGPRLRGDERI